MRKIVLYDFLIRLISCIRCLNILKGKYMGSVYVTIDELKFYTVSMKIKNWGRSAYFKDGTLAMNNVPKGTLFKINETLIKNGAGDVGYIKRHNLWYVIFGDHVLWSNFKISDPKEKIESSKPRFNRYTALTKRRG